MRRMAIYYKKKMSAMGLCINAAIAQSMYVPLSLQQGVTVYDLVNNTYAMVRIGMSAAEIWRLKHTVEINSRDTVLFACGLFHMREIFDAYELYSIEDFFILEQQDMDALTITPAQLEGLKNAAKLEWTWLNTY